MSEALMMLVVVKFRMKFLSCALVIAPSAVAQRMVGCMRVAGQTKNISNRG